MTSEMFRKHAMPAMLLALGVVVVPVAAMAQAASSQGATAQSPVATAKDAAATWAGFAASQQLFGPPGASPAAPSGVTTANGAVIAPAEVNGHVPEPTKPGNGDDGILRSAAPAVAVDAEGHGAVVSGASLR